MCQKRNLQIPSFIAIVCICYVFGVTAAQNETDPCPEGFFGFQCKKACNKNCVSSTCHEMTGECTEGCLDGWFGANCEYACEEGTYGNNCSTPCSENCLGGVCQPDSGDCIKGCLDGYIGPHCDKLCPQGTWGQACAGTCSPNCATPHCHFQSGYCLRGCKEDFWGVDCSLFGQLKDVPDKMRGTFYNQLSAESRTVMLYILMGKYRHTLKEAARQVEEGKHQRDELRQLLEGRGVRRRKYNI